MNYHKKGNASKCTVKEKKKTINETTDIPYPIDQWEGHHGNKRRKKNQWEEHNGNQKKKEDQWKGHNETKRRKKNQWEGHNNNDFKKEERITEGNKWKQNHV